VKCFCVWDGERRRTEDVAFRATLNRAVHHTAARTTIVRTRTAIATETNLS